MPKANEAAISDALSLGLELSMKMEALGDLLLSYNGEYQVEHKTVRGVGEMLSSLSKEAYKIYELLDAPPRKDCALVDSETK